MVLEAFYRLIKVYHMENITVELVTFYIYCLKFLWQSVWTII